MYMTWGFASCLRRTAIADAVHSGTKEEIPRRRYPAFELHIRPEQARRESHLVHQRSTGMLQLLMTLTRARGEGGGGGGRIENGPERNGSGGGEDRMPLFGLSPALIHYP